MERQARMETFAGYLMPIVYKGQSIKTEHLQTRHSASAFDVSHMMQTMIRGKDRVKFLESITVADIKGLGSNKCSLSVFTNDFGGIIDDCIIGKCDDYIHIVSNAANADKVWKRMNEQLKEHPMDVDIEKLDNRGLIALQGPKASDALQRHVAINLKDLKFMNTTKTNLENIGESQITRCGYTGEDGFEISIEGERAKLLMEILCENEHVKPAGLGARDTLRLEAGLCLHGHDIDDKTTPIEASLNWVVQKRRRLEGGFPGHSRIMEQLEKGTPTKRVGLIARNEGGPPAREGCEVLDSEGSKLGLVTSGNYAPTLNRNIAMAYIKTEHLANKEKDSSCLVRGKKYEYQITKMPFVKTNYYI